MQFTVLMVGLFALLNQFQHLLFDLQLLALYLDQFLLQLLVLPASESKLELVLLLRDLVLLDASAQSLDLLQCLLKLKNCSRQIKHAVGLECLIQQTLAVDQADVTGCLGAVHRRRVSTAVTVLGLKGTGR